MLRLVRIDVASCPMKGDTRIRPSTYAAGAAVVALTCARMFSSIPNPR
jgi:hypothetical protein